MPWQHVICLNEGVAEARNENGRKTCVDDANGGGGEKQRRAENGFSDSSSCTVIYQVQEWVKHTRIECVVGTKMPTEFQPEIQ